MPSRKLKVDLEVNEEALCNKLVVGDGYSDDAPPSNGAIIEGFLGIGTNNPLTSLHFMGGVAANHKNKTANYTLTDSDFWISFSGAGQTMTLPEFAGSSTQNQLFLIKNANASLSGTVDTAGSSTIDGNSSITLGGKEAALFGWGGTNYQILLHFSGSI